MTQGKTVEEIREEALSIARPLRKDRDFEKIIGVIQGLLEQKHSLEQEKEGLNFQLEESHKSNADWKARYEAGQQEKERLREAVMNLLASHNCLTNGNPEIAESISAEFDIGLDVARQISGLVLTPEKGTPHA